MNDQVIATPLNKISVKSVFGAVPVKPGTDEDGKHFVRLEAPIILMRVIGQASGYEIKTSEYGESLKFKGMFKAYNLDTGEIFSSAACFLPSIVEGQLGEILAKMDGGAVEFAFDVGAVPAGNAHGYEYRVQPLIAAAESPVLASIESKLPPLPLALENKSEPTTKAAKGKGK